MVFLSSFFRDGLYFADRLNSNLRNAIATQVVKVNPRVGAGRYRHSK